MARNDFISDHLVNMRDRFKQNYAETHSADSTASAPASTPEPADSTDSAASVAPERVETSTTAVKDAAMKIISAPATMLRTSGRSEEFERMRRDLEGRLNRDTAAVTAELEHAAQRRAELERFQAKLADFTRRYAELAGAGDAESARRLEHLRIEYFQAYGRVRAFDAAFPVSMGAAANAGVAGRRREWMAPAATLVATVLLCVTLLILFW